MDEIYRCVYEHVLQHDWKWRISGTRVVPTYEDVCKLVDRMTDQVRKSQGSISIESGGLLIKRTDDYIDVYVHAGGIK